jgi:hypothetical protein
MSNNKKEANNKSLKLHPNPQNKNSMTGKKKQSPNEIMYS